MNKVRLLAAFFCVASILFLVLLVPQVGANNGSGFGSLSFYSVGPTALPYFAGALVLIFSIAVMVSPGSSKDDEATSQNEADERAVTAPAGGSSIWRGLLFTTIMLIYSMSIFVLGFQLASVAFLAVVFIAFRPASWKIALAVALLVPFGIDWLLREAFLIPLPSGILF